MAMDPVSIAIVGGTAWIIKWMVTSDGEVKLDLTCPGCGEKVARTLAKSAIKGTFNFACPGCGFSEAVELADVSSA